jgi:hypothetical protein
MKKIMCFIFSVLLFNSCTTTEKYISARTLENQLKKVDSCYNSLGFNLSGVKSNSQNDLHVSGYNYSSLIGISSVLENDIMYRDTYIFRNKNNNTVKFTIQYKVVGTNGELDYVSICECETDKSDLYNKLCNNKDLTSINSLPKNNFKYTSPGKTSIVVGFIAIATFIIIASQNKNFY